MSLNPANTSFRQSRFLMVTIFGALLLAGCGCVEDKKSSPGWRGDAKKDGPAAKGWAKKSDPTEARPSESPPPAVPATAVAMAGVERRSRPAQPLPQSGVLTAGSFDDNLEPGYFRDFARRIGQHPAAGDLPGKFTGRRVTLVVKDGAGRPVGNARVRLESAGNNGQEWISRSDGRVILLSGFDNLAWQGELRVAVTPPNGPTVKQTIPAGVERWEVTMSGSSAQLPDSLDLAIVLDTTGSMGDELRFLQSEIRSITSTIKSRFPNVDQRFSLVLYRDDGDEYVTRPFDFTTSIDTFHRNLVAQSAAGGGDEPEAMHRALEEAQQLRWRDGNTARVLFLITDAPPHAQHVNRTLAAADRLRRRGIAIYPIACSGYNEAAEFILRTCALMTGSQFLFLTNDSGVGNAHAEPHTPFYQVQRLERMMTRMIESELSGRRIAPQPSDIIRTVGKPIN
jgi:Mg-chelatase subunit ChlD